MPEKKNLVIVESPAKAKTIEKYLGKDYKVVASMGHLRDLPKSRLGVDLENGFEPEYINVRDKSALINELKKDAKNANNISYTQLLFFVGRFSVYCNVFAFNQSYSHAAGKTDVCR